MSIFKETFQPFVYNQLQLRKHLQNSGSFDRFGAHIMKYSASADNGDPIIKEVDLTDSPGAFFVNSTKRQCTIKMSSGVDLIGDAGVLEGTEYEKHLKNEKMAKNYVLMGGTQVFDQSYSEEPETITSYKRGGIGITKDSFNNPSVTDWHAYGDPHIRADAKEGYGIVPMPGIKDMTIRTTSAYGSLRVANVKFFCHNKRQLEILEMLYMRPGYPILIEWGWAPYINNDGGIENNIGFVSEDQFFNSDSTIDSVNNDIYEKRKQAGGNYDGFLGFCKNFEFKAREDGGYDCFTEIIAAGEILEGLKGKREGENGATRYATTYEEFIYKRTGISRQTSTYREEGIDFSDMQGQILFEEYGEDGKISSIIGPTYDALTDFYIQNVYNTPDSEIPLDLIGDEEALLRFERTRKELYPVDNLELYLMALDDTTRRKLAFEKLKSEDHTPAVNDMVEINQGDYDDLYFLVKQILEDQDYSPSQQDVMAFIENSLIHDMSYRDLDPRDFDGTDDVLGNTWYYERNNIEGRQSGEPWEDPENDVEDSGHVLTTEERKEGHADNNIYHDINNYDEFADSDWKDRKFNRPKEMKRYEGINIQEIPATFIRWDFLVEIINKFCIPYYKKEGKKQHPITALTYLRDNIGKKGKKRNNNEYLSYNKFFLTDTPLASVDDNYASLGRALDKSIDPSVCWLPNQAGIGSDTIPEFMDVGSTLEQEIEDSEYKNHQDIYNGLYPLRGKNKKNQLNSIGYIYLNIRHLRDTYRKMRYFDDTDFDTDKSPHLGLRHDFSIMKFLDQIWQDVNKACGDVHNFQLQTDHEDTQKVRVIDLHFEATHLKDNLFELDIEGENSIVRDFNYNSTIPSALTSTIAVAAQAGEDIDNLEKVSFAAFNNRIKSRFSNTDIDAQKLKDKMKELLTNFKTNVNQLLQYYGQIESGMGWYNLKLGLEQPLIMKDAAFRMLQQVQKDIININSRDLTTGKPLKGSEISIGKSSIIPIKFTARLDGIGGMVIGNVFRVNPKHLPKSYQERSIAFVVTSEEQTVTSGQDWTTDIGGQLILRDEKERKEQLSMKNSQASYSQSELDAITQGSSFMEDENGEEVSMETPNADFVREYFKFCFQVTPDSKVVNDSYADRWGWHEGSQTGDNMTELIFGENWEQFIGVTTDMDWTELNVPDIAHMAIESLPYGSEILDAADTSTYMEIYDIIENNSLGATSTEDLRYKLLSRYGEHASKELLASLNFVKITPAMLSESGNDGFKKTGMDAGALTKSTSFPPGRDITEYTAITIISLFTEILKRVSGIKLKITGGGRNPIPNLIKGKKHADYGTNHAHGHSFDFSFDTFSNDPDNYKLKYLQIVEIIRHFMSPMWTCDWDNIAPKVTSAEMIEEYKSMIPECNSSKTGPEVGMCSVNNFRFLNEYEFKSWIRGTDPPQYKAKSKASKIKNYQYGKFSPKGRGDHFHISTNDQPDALGAKYNIASNPGEGEESRDNNFGDPCWGEGWMQAYFYWARDGGKGGFGFMVNSGPFPGGIGFSKDMDYQELYYRLNEEYRPRSAGGAHYDQEFDDPTKLRQHWGGAFNPQFVTDMHIKNAQIAANEVTCSKLKQMLIESTTTYKNMTLEQQQDAYPSTFQFPDTEEYVGTEDDVWGTFYYGWDWGSEYGPGLAPDFGDWMDLDYTHSGDPSQLGWWNFYNH